MISFLSKKLDRIGNVVCWLLIIWAVVWICLFAIPSFVDRISRHEAEWTDGGGRHTEEMVSPKMSRED